MKEENCALLFEYLRSILYDHRIQALDPEQLDEPFQLLGKGLAFLQQEVEEMRCYTEELSKGNLSVPCPPKENFLCENLKNLQANLNHLSWQARRVAEGDYSQHVSYLGEFSDSFNTMISQLKERERLLKEETLKVQRRAQVIEEYNKLLIEMTRKRNEWIIVVEAEQRKIIYCNKQDGRGELEYTVCEHCDNRRSFLHDVLNWQDSEQFKVWETGDESHGFYRITTFHIEWQGLNSFAHIVEDITEDKKAAKRLNRKAYDDPGTGWHNRLFFEEYMEKVLQGEDREILCYMDLDGLKYVNDHFGHNEGDAYLRYFADTIRNAFQKNDIYARIGGDEFCLILPEGRCSIAERKLQSLLEHFIEHNPKPYPISFSFGVIEIDGKRKVTLKDILREADRKMYDCKKLNKQKYHENREIR